MDVWHWTSLVALLCYAGLESIPDAYYQAAKIDGASRWAVFRYIQLPKMKRVLLIAVLLRFMDSFMIYTEPFVVTGGGPATPTTFLSIDLVKIALGQFDLGPAAAMSLVYFLIILLLCWVFYTVMTGDAERPGHDPRRSRLRRALPWCRDDLHPVPDAADLLARQHELQDQWRSSAPSTLWPHDLTFANYRSDLHRPAWYSGYINSIIYVVINTVILRSGRGPAGGLRLLALPVPRRQAPVLLAAHQPHGAAGRLRAAVLPALFGIGLFDTPYRGGAGPLPVQHPARRLDPRRASCPACRRRSTRPPISTAIPFPRFFVRIFMPLIASGIGVAAFFCFMFSWVELLLPGR